MKPLNLGELAYQLGSIIRSITPSVVPSPSSIYPVVVFDFGFASPKGFAGYRGDENILAIGYDGAHGYAVAATAFQAELLALQRGKSVPTRKRYPLKPSRETEIYIACKGVYSRTRISGATICHDNWIVTIHTFEEAES
jgi:hypothetical protein